MLSNSGLGSQNLRLYSQFPETLGRSPPLSGPTSSPGGGSCRVDFLLYKNGLLWFLFTRGSASL